MIDEDKLIKMYEIVMGKPKPNSNCHIEIIYDDCSNPIAVATQKHGLLYASKTITELTFEYITKDWE